MEEKENVHKMHRSRMRKKYAEMGLQAFAPHEVLEFLLFYSYRRVDTNEIAHRLLKKFGTISGVFDADLQSLMEVEGVGENAAIFLKLQNDLQRYCMIERFSEEKNTRITPDNIGTYASCLFYGHADEVFYMISLTADCELISADIVARGTVNSIAVYSREVVKKALETKATLVILAHNHPNGMLVPSEADIKTTKILSDALNFVNVKIIDHIIFGGGECISLLKDYDVL